MTDTPGEKPEQPAARPEVKEADKPEVKIVAEKPEAKLVAKPAHGEAKPAEPSPPLEPAFFGTFLKELGIESKRLPDQLGAEAIVIDKKDLEAAMKFLKNSPETQLNYLVSVSGVEQTDAFESVYHLWSYHNNKELTVKVSMSKADIPEGKLPVVQSLSNFWPAANWHERETFDLMGIRYASHPYLRRILNPWDWDGHPLRRDYKQPIDALNDKHPHSMR